MNWGSLVSAIMPTIGNVVGSLLGSNTIEDGVIEYVHNEVVGADQEFSSVFFKKGDDYYLFNQSPQEEDTVAMTFPACGQIGAETILVPGRVSFNVTPMFKQNADKDNVQFELTACSASNVEGIGEPAQKQKITISSSGKQIPVGGEKQSIGTYFEVQVGTQEVTILPKSGVSITSLPMVSVQSSGQTGMRMMDVKGEGDVAKVQLPQTLVQDELVSVEVIADVEKSCLSAMIKQQANDERMILVDDATAQRIRNAPRLNRR